jgi:TetR/AcrR family transcriptional regulator, fatty acid metabolism regulator protein
MEEITDRQQQIIVSAGRLLTRSGIGGLTIKNLAGEMNFSEGAVYRHFKSKENILVRMLEFLASDMDRRLAEVVKKESDPVEKFEAVFKDQLRFFSKNPHFVVAVFSDGLMEESDRINQKILEIMQVKMRHLFPIVFEGQRKGVFTGEVSCEELIHVIIGTFRLQMFRWRAMGFSYDIEKKGSETIQSLLKVIKN